MQKKLPYIYRYYNIAVRTKFGIVSVNYSFSSFKHKSINISQRFNQN